MENSWRRETRPLLNSSERGSLWQRLRHASLRLPSERTISVIILGLFLIVIILLLLMKNMITISNDDDEDESFIPNTSDEDILFKLPEHVGESDFQKAWKDGVKLAAERKKLEKLLFVKGITPPKDSPSARLQAFLKPQNLSHEFAYCAVVIEHVRRTMKQCVNASILPRHCESSKPSKCDPDYPYRTYNGSCNNLRNPTWGMSFTPFTRLLVPDYADGVSLPRVSVNGDKLPNARLLSSRLYSHRSKPDSNSTLLFMNFGLFIDHDLVRIALQTGHNDTQISCCDPYVLKNPSFRHPECLEIDVPGFDPFFGPLGITCLDFVRSAPVSGECPGRREQLNLATSYLDGSGIYGATELSANNLRFFVGGQLKGQILNGTLMLPLDAAAGYSCGTPVEPLGCFDAGDKRVNEQVELMAMHVLWFREHNRVASKLKILRPEWDDEMLFQESRRIVVAELQHITYNEFLPLLLGRKAIEKYELEIIRNKIYDKYDSKQPGGAYNVFAAAAFRFGHSLIQGLIDLVSPEGCSKRNKIPLHETFLNPSIICHSGLDLLLRGLTKQSSHSVDSYITPEVRNHLFQPFGKTYGTDLSALGIQRGRDHGTPGYTAWRRLCKLPEVNEWEDLSLYMDKSHVNRLRELYMSVDDIDFTPAALAENHEEGAMLGPTHICLIARQFQRTRISDRFWFEIQNEKWSFSKDQLQELYNSNIARIVCDNSDNIQRIQKFALKKPSTNNPVLDCSELPEVDLAKWAT